MLRSSCFKGAVIEWTVNAVKPNASASAPSSRPDRQLDGKFGVTRRRISARQGLLLHPFNDPVEMVVNSHDPALGLRQEGVTCCAVVARIGDARLAREIGHGVNFALDRLDGLGVNFGNRLQVGVQSRRGEVRLLLRLRELRDGGVDRPIFQVAKVLAG